MVTSRGRTRVALLRLALCYSVVPLRLTHKPIPYEDRKESRGVVTSRGRTRVPLLRLALCYSVVPLHPAHKPIPYEDSKRMCQSNQIKLAIFLFSLAIIYQIYTYFLTWYYCFYVTGVVIMQYTKVSFKNLQLECHVRD